MKLTTEEAMKNPVLKRAIEAAKKGPSAAQEARSMLQGVNPAFPLAKAQGRKLKPCPFCGGRAAHKKSWAPDNLAVARIVYCAREIMCGANLHVLFPVTQDEAAKHWNARAK